MSRWPNATPEKVRKNIADGLGGLTRGLHHLKKPTIAAVNGWALAGVETALAVIFVLHLSMLSLGLLRLGEDFIMVMGGYQG